jgi:hypothetical protein
MERYKKLVEYTYHPEYRLPTKKTTTLYNAAFEPGPPSVNLMGWDWYGNQVVNSQHVVGSEAEATTQVSKHESRFQTPLKQYTRQHQDTYLVRENTVDNSNGNVTQTRDMLVDITQGVATAQSDSGVWLDYSQRRWIWVTPAIANSYIEVKTFYVATPIRKEIYYVVRARKLGETAWLKQETHGNIGGWSWGDDVKDWPVIRFDLPSPGVYEVEVVITKVTGYCGVEILSIDYDERGLAVEGPIVTDYAYDPNASVNLVAKTLTEKDGRQRIWQYEYTPEVLDQGYEVNNFLISVQRSFQHDIQRIVNSHTPGENSISGICGAVA